MIHRIWILLALVVSFCFVSFERSVRPLTFANENFHSPSGCFLRTPSTPTRRLFFHRTQCRRPPSLPRRFSQPIWFLPLAADAGVLNNTRYVQRAEYRHGNSKRCLRGMRMDIPDEIELCTHDSNRPLVHWLNGFAGTDKSTNFCQLPVFP